MCSLVHGELKGKWGSVNLAGMSHDITCIGERCHDHLAVNPQLHAHLALCVH